MDIRRVALIFDNVQRPETTGGYCLRALRSLVEVQHFQPGELERIPRAGFDLYLNIDDGLRYHLPDDLRPSAWWAIDTHMDFAWCLEKSKGFDVVFAAQRYGAEQLRRAGIDSAAWLPLACDPEIHAKHDVSKRYDVAFVGNVFPGSRSDLLELIRRRYLRTFVGQCYFDDMARTFSAAHTVFNRSIKNDVNMRVFEALACGSLLLTNDLRDNGQQELFQDGVHLATYREPEDLLDKLAFYLEREPLREQIAAAGRALALSEHTYRHRMERLFRETIEQVGEGWRAWKPRVRDASARGACDAINDGRSVEAAWSGYDRFYFGHVRPEVLALIPETSRRVLDVGCGAGRLGEALKARQEATVSGIELDQAAAEMARRRLDQVWTGDVEQIDLELPPGSFDAIVCADIIEHLREPHRLLRRVREWLAPGGSLIASIPNVRHHSVVRSLLQGNWTYEPAGLLDRTHLRFFTRREIEKVLYRAGFAVEEIRAVIAPGDDPAAGSRVGALRLGRLSIDGLSGPDAAEFTTYQFLVRARPAELAAFGLTSIVIVTHNELDYTRQCLDSVRGLTDEPYELIVVDNGSTDGTVEYLRALPGVRLIANGGNRGFPAAVNQGMAVAAGSQILLLNNDVVVTTGWLDRMLRTLRADVRVGLVGPRSNFVSGPQQLEPGYDDLAELDGFAWDWGKANDAQYFEVHRLVGFCLLIRRDVVDAIGALDEQFGIGCFEDDDYCLRAIRAGFRAVIAGDAFVHHYGGRTFAGSGVNVGALLRENQRRFRAKWLASGSAAPGSAGHQSDAPTSADGDQSLEREGNEQPLPSPSPGSASDTPARPLAVGIAPGGGLRLCRDVQQPRLSLCMIVRDSAKTLPACLESIRPWVDEMVVVDTGSVDETPRIVESFGGCLFHFPWCDDFSAARNESLRHARGDWLFWMDSDDTIPPECGCRLRGLIERDVPASVLGFVMQVHCPGGGEEGEADCDVTVVDHVKLLRNRPGLRFDGRIHEQVLPAIRALGGDVAWSDLYVVHSGSDQSKEAQEKKRRRDLHLLQLELAERPEHPFTLFNLGMTHVHGSQYAEGAEYLRRGIGRSGPEESHLRKAYALLVYAEMRLGYREQALATCRQGRSLFPRDVELQFREGVVLHELGRLAQARRAYLGVLENHEERHFASVDRALTGFKARQNLAVVAGDMGDLAEAERQWRHVTREVPHYRPGWRGLGETLVRAGRFAEAESLAARLLEDRVLRIEGLLLQSRMARSLGRADEARAALEQAAAEHPEDLEALRSRCHFLFEHGPSGEAEAALRALAERNPEDPSAHHNLGALLLRNRRYDEAAAAYRRALRYRPDYAPTHLDLGYALKDSGHIDEAVAAWEQAIRLAPGDPAPRLELVKLGQTPTLGASRSTS
jgi:GT2 family glycosyltransferase/tetratricopeptide (TPR) repeat protein/2-polyprenyl-3-methyl-5-hydroxy-6-metoxy-1,4-benzoquinol methylase